MATRLNELTDGSHPEPSEHGDKVYSGFVGVAFAGRVPPFRSSRYCKASCAKACRAKGRARQKCKKAGRMSLGNQMIWTNMDSAQDCLRCSSSDREKIGQSRPPILRESILESRWYRFESSSVA